MTSKFKVSQRSDRSFGERDVSARATHLKAAIGKVSMTTIERKIMSTKTTFKRIALVAVASLGLGLLSIVPAQAIPSITITAVNGTADTAAGVLVADSTNAAVLTITGSIEKGDSITVEIAQKSNTGNATAFGQVYLTNRDSATPILANGLILDTISSSTAANVTSENKTGAGVNNRLFQIETGLTTAGVHTAAQTDVVRITRDTNASGGTVANFTQRIGVQFDSAVATSRSAGTYTFTYFVKTFAVGSTAPVNTYSGDISIVIATLTSVATTPSASTSFERLYATAQSAGTGSAGSDAVISGLATAGTTSGYMYVGNRNASGTTNVARDSITVTVTGAGVVCTPSTSFGTTASTCGKTLSRVSVTGGDYQFILQGDGTAGNGTIVVSAAVAGWSATSYVSYYAKAAKTITATVLTPVLAVGSNDSAVAITAVDSNGIAWAGTPYIYASSAADATAVGGSSSTPVACVWNSSKSTAWCPITAVAAGTGKFKVIDAAAIADATATSNEVSVTSSSAQAATVTIKFDKDSYAPGEKATITVTPLSSTGARLAAGTFTSLLASGGITSTTGFNSGSGGATASDIAATAISTNAYTGTDLVAGSKVYVVYMPLGSGTVTITAKGGSLLPAAGQVTVTASATVTSDGSAALAAVTALASQVSAFITKINAQITTLTDLVMKIQKKVKA